MRITESVKTFYRCLKALMYSAKRNGFKRGSMVCYFAKSRDAGGDFLTIYRYGPNNYTLSFDSCKGYSWKHEECRLIDIKYALMTWDEFTFNDGWFEY